MMHVSAATGCDPLSDQDQQPGPTTRVSDPFTTLQNYGPARLARRVDANMVRHRVRICFRKEGDLRLISHRDLLRTFERLFRRAEFPLSMSEGFHPKPRMSFPSALGLGIEGCNEVMEIELSEELPDDEITTRLRRHTPPGLMISDVQALAPGEPKAQVAKMRYEFPVPGDRAGAVRQTVADLMSERSRLIRREGRRDPIDLRAGIAELSIKGEVLQMTLRSSREASVRPLEVIRALGLADLEAKGAYLRRTAVELST